MDVGLVSKAIRGAIASLGRLPPWVDRDDCFQEAFILLSRQLADRRRYEGVRDLERWSFVVAKRAVFDYLRVADRRRKRFGATNDEGRLGYVPDRLDVVHPGPETFDLLDELPDKYRDVLLLFYKEGLKFRTIGRRLGIPEGTVKSRLSDGLKRLRNSPDVKKYRAATALGSL